MPGGSGGPKVSHTFSVVTPVPPTFAVPGAVAMADTEVVAVTYVGSSTLSTGGPPGAIWDGAGTTPVDVVG